MAAGLPRLRLQPGRGPPGARRWPRSASLRVHGLARPPALRAAAPALCGAARPRHLPGLRGLRPRGDVRHAAHRCGPPWPWPSAVRATRRWPRRACIAALGAVLGLGFLTKGPVAVLFPGLALLVLVAASTGRRLAASATAGRARGDRARDSSAAWVVRRRLPAPRARPARVLLPAREPRALRGRDLRQPAARLCYLRRRPTSPRACPGRCSFPLAIRRCCERGASGARGLPPALDRPRCSCP